MSEGSAVGDRIALALLSILSDKPLERITVSEIAERAGVSRISYYRNFTSKEDILLSYSDRVLSSIADDIRIGRIRSSLEFWQRIYSDLSCSGLMCKMRKAGLEDRFFRMFETKLEDICTSFAGLDLSSKVNVVMMEFSMGGLVSLMRPPMLKAKGISDDDVASFLAKVWDVVNADREVQEAL